MPSEIGQFLFMLVAGAWIVVTPWVFVLSWQRLQGRSLFTRLTASLLYAASAFMLCAFTPFAWLLRDGLGPDAIESYGLVALSRFEAFFIPVLLVAAVPCAMGLLLCYAPWGQRARR